MRSYKDTETDVLVWWLGNAIRRGEDNRDLYARLDDILDYVDELAHRFPQGEVLTDAHNAAILAKFGEV